MTNAELIAKIKAEIEKLKTFYGELHTDFVCETLLSFLSTLELEKSVPAELEEAAHSYSESDEPLYSPGHRFHWDSDSLFGKQIETTFIAGAKWQKERDEMSKVNYEGARAVYDNTVQHLQEKIDEKYELGKKDMKEQMLKEAVEGVLVDNVDGTQEICLHGNRYGDKVRIIIVNDEK